MHLPFAHTKYDILIVGARCAGAATAMLLASAGLKVLCVDRKPLGSDTISTHALMRPAVVQLARWGILDRLLSLSTPLITKTTFHYGSAATSFDLRPDYGIPGLIAPRRTLLDSVLVEQARRTGAEIVHGVSVTNLGFDANGKACGAHLRTPYGDTYIQAGTIIGADGIGSNVARAVNAPSHSLSTASTSHVYAYVELPQNDGYHWYFTEAAAASLIPTNNLSACVVASIPSRRYDELFASDHEVGWRAVLREVSPELAEESIARRNTGFKAFRGRPGHMRQAYGPGWALVGDAGFFRDPITSHGISDALRDAEMLSSAILAESESALRLYQSERDEIASHVLRATDAISSFEWTLCELESLHRTLGKIVKREAEKMAHRNAQSARPIAA